MRTELGWASLLGQFVDLWPLHSTGAAVETDWRARPIFAEAALSQRMIFNLKQITVQSQQPSPVRSGTFRHSGLPSLLKAGKLDKIWFDQN